MSASHNVKTLVVFWTLILCCPSFTYAVLNWEIQRYDGWYNNLAYHSRGTVDSPFVRLLPARYADGVYQVLQEPELPNPRNISNMAMEGKSGIPCSKNRTVLFVYFGYLVMDEILEVIGTGCPTEFLNIQVPSGDPVFDPNSTGKVELPFQRSRWSIISGQSPNNPRVQINHVTTWIDGSSIYGASRSWSDTLRTFSDGLLASGSDKLLPRQSNGLINLWKFADPATGQHGLNGFYDFGNAKANESPFLRAQNIIWFRYHNYLAAQLQAQNPMWTDEELFQKARKQVIGTFQRILFYEWLPAFIGQDVSPYGGYKKYVDPSISPEFQAAAIRTLNSLIPPGIYMRNSTCQFRNVVNVYNRIDPALRVCNNFWSRENPNFKNAKDIDELILGMVSQRAEQEDNIVVKDLRDFMYGPLRFTRSDVVALDIQRGRDNGLPSYNQVREALDLEPVGNWSDINADLYRENPELINQLAALYNNDISKLELFVGGMLENSDSSSRLFTVIIKKQFEHIRDGDRFWFENAKNGIFTEAELRSIWNTTFRDVLLATIAKPGNIQKDLFYLKDDDPCVQPKQLTDSDMEPCVKVNTLHYFDGSGAGFGILIVALCCFPLAALLLAFMISLSRKREKKRLQNMKASVKRQISPGDKIQASEWQGPKEALRHVSIILNSNKCIKVMDSKHSVIRNIRLGNDNHFDVIQSTNKEQKALLLKVPKEYDLVLMFNNEDERKEFVADLKKYLDHHSIHLLVHEVRERTLLKEAVTKQQRIKILDTFFRRVFAQVLEIDGSDAGDFDNETQKKAKESLNCELTPAEFADALGVKEDSMFVEQMFILADKDGNGYLSFREFMDIFVILMNGSPEAKSRLMFNMYDVDGSGSMSKEEFLQLLRSFIEISNNCLSKDQTQEVMESMFKEAGFEDKEELMWEDFHYLFRDHYSELKLAQLNVKGAGGQNRDKPSRVSCIIKKKPSEKTEPTEASEEKTNQLDAKILPNQEGFVMDLRKRFGKKSSQLPRKIFAEAKREKYIKNKFQQKVQEYIQYVQNYQRQIFCTMIFFAITAGVFVERAYYYAVLREHSGVPQTTRVGLIIARGSAAAISFMYSYLLLTMCRNLITVLRETFLNRYIPFDSAVDFHRWVAMAAAFFSVLHSAAHAVNIYAFSANPLNVLACLFPEVVHDDGSELPLKYYWWFFQNITGMTGVLLLFFFSFLHIFALHYFRRISFRAFWVSHHLYIAIYILMLLHGSAALLQPQRFHIYLIIPTLIFVGDKFVSYSRKKIEITVVNAQLLPSGVTYLEFKRPRYFDYMSGQWVRIASLVLGTNEYHPFTLTSAPHESTLSLHIRAVGPWTMRLREIYSPENILTLGSYPKIYLDGPFGEGHQEWNKFEVSVLVGGGIGVTPFASILKDLVYKSTIKDKISCKKIYFIWVTRTQRQFEWLEDIIREVEATDKKLLVSVHIYITQLAEKFDLRTTMLYICERHFQKISNRSLFTGLQSITHFGRPQFIPFFRSIVDVHPETSKIGVFSCGPPGMTRNVEKACKQMNKRQNIQFHHHYENF